MQAEEHTATAEKILQAASRMFAARGFANVSVRDICKKAETTAPVIYYYFGSKKGLFDAVVRRQISMQGFIGKLSQASKAADPRDGLESFIVTYLTTFPEHTFDMGLYMRDSATLDKQSAERVSEDLEKIKGIATTMVERSMAKGLFRKTDADSAVDCLLGMLNRVIFQHIHFAKSLDREAYTRFVTDFFFRAMK
ncbi:MAG: TetR/AcrR family transcriptional regulator [Nitrososphaerota archaeon]|jgi:AcrR family transcriptional regulator|nr:TetR/AcrR family transcriptional regulator [Nitrososphaerota archaeon]MCL5672044.1 TetR/AcrR family transcriptional regulator [Nitrososphaerota archaeon]MDG6903678.1 TetR/AcrR family transcriptional regulator [Nitrososphaerota archaeon]MDG6911995.1 TetR/AcrR family transcriptional regulator [Nitrososphaerota archaeon]MDG6924527.1 TetR/AcrR family transcriptional regulator [Nitrososphaerota archaeon]